MKRWPYWIWGSSSLSPSQLWLKDQNLLCKLISFPPDFPIPLSKSWATFLFAYEFFSSACFSHSLWVSKILQNQTVTGVFATNSTGAIHMQKKKKMNLSPYFTLFTKINSKSTIDLNVRAKTTVKEMKRQGTEWKRIFVKQESDKGLVFKLYKELLQLKKKTTRFWKCVKN